MDNQIRKRYGQRLSAGRRLVLCLLAVALLPLPAVAGGQGDADVKEACLRSLVRFMTYARSIYHDVGVNERGDSVGVFGVLPLSSYLAPRTSHLESPEGGTPSDEDGVRTNADMAMVVAFVHEYGQEARMPLPDGLTYPELRRMATRALRYGYSTHRANGLMTCSDGKQWGSADGVGQWESSLWAFSLALAEEFLNFNLEKRDEEGVARIVAAEADHLLTKKVPTDYRGDTKAEENEWDANILACAWARMPLHEHADLWHDALLRYGLNGYTVATDAQDSTMIAGALVCDWYAGANLFPDFTLQNHGYFHPGYQHVVMQEQAESILALHLLTGRQPDSDLRRTLTWHWQEVWQRVLAWLALPDGDLAMPNGNDWSLRLFDQLPTYAAMATLMGNADALMLEARCLRSLLARQAQTADGSYMLHPDIGARRMGVTAHRVMMTWLMHDLYGQWVAPQPSSWDDFARRHAATRLFSSQGLIRSMNQNRFACLSWSEGLKNLSMMICTSRSGERGAGSEDSEQARKGIEREKNLKVENTANSTRDNLSSLPAPRSPLPESTLLPYKEGHGGNVFGKIKGEPAKPTFIVPANEERGAGSEEHLSNYDTTEWVACACGHHPYCVWVTPGNVVIAVVDGRNEHAGMLAIGIEKVLSRSEERGAGSENGEQALTSAHTTGQKLSSLHAPRSPLLEAKLLPRTLYHEGGSVASDGTETLSLSGSWVNVEGQVGMVSPNVIGKRKKVKRPEGYRFGEQRLVSSLPTAKLWPKAAGNPDGLMTQLYYTNVSAEQTQRLAATAFDLSRDGWTIIVCDDTDGTRYLLAFNASGTARPFRLPKELKKEENNLVIRVVGE